MTGDCLKVEFPDFPNSLQHCKWDMFLSRFFVFLFGVYYHLSSSQSNVKADEYHFFLLPTVGETFEANQSFS